MSNDADKFLQSLVEDLTPVEAQQALASREIQPIDLAINSSTPLDFENSLEDLQSSEESVNPGDSPQLVLMALLANISINQDGGYTLTFQVPATDKEEVARLLTMTARVLPIIIMTGTPDETPGQE